ncbi:hypothetical protein I5V52_03420 [Stenotrophomonas maltophilia]|nr:hypothetical protein [Stenotrophomonas maltophilia]MBH1762044.1 hypothetical protein [Stenotrophomonas maltophilia]MBH1771243.1 hypothetical protein [Stenotrophomonas maltophilia]
MHLGVQPRSAGGVCHFLGFLDLRAIRRKTANDRACSARRQGLVFLAGQQSDACTGSAANPARLEQAQLVGLLLGFGLGGVLGKRKPRMYRRAINEVGNAR